MKKNLKKLHTRGFSIIELVVVISIFSIISTVTIFNYNGYQSRIGRVNLAQDIALSIRQSQVYGLSASQRILGSEDFDVADNADVFFSTGSAADIITDRSVRGVNIDTNTKTILLFEDNDRNFKYGALNDRIIDERTAPSHRIKMTACVFLTASVSLDPSCPGGVSTSNPINISFQRPYPDATIEHSNTQYTTAVVHIMDATDSAVESVPIQIESSGQIIVHGA